MLIWLIPNQSLAQALLLGWFLWKAEWFIWIIRLGKDTKNAQLSYFQALFLESAGCRRHILLSATAVMRNSFWQHDRQGKSQLHRHAPSLSYKSLEVDLMTTGERQGVRKPRFSSQVQAVFSNPYLPVMKMTIYLFMYNWINLAISLESKERERRTWWFSYSNKSLHIK